MPERKVAFNRNTIVGILLAASFVSLLNQTLLIVAIPPIMEDFGIGPSQAQWVTTAFLLMNGIMIPITAFLIEKFSSKALLIASMGIFSLGTLIGALAPSFIILLAARIIQAAGAGILMPLMQTVMITLYPQEKRGSAMGMSGLIIGFAPAIGPTLAGWIVDTFNWRYLFYTVLPISLLVLLGAVFLMKNVTEQKKVDVDMLSVILSSLGWGGLLYGFSMVGSAGWSDQSVIGSIAVGAVTLALFIRRQNRLERPMLNFHVFRYREFTLTLILSVLMFGVMIGIETVLPIYVQNVRGGSALESGMILLPGAILTGAMAPVAGKIYDKFGVRGITIAGFCMMLAGVLLYLTMGMNTSFIIVAVIFCTEMLGFSLLMTPLMTAGINALPFHLIAHGTAMSNTIRTVGASIITAIVVSVMSTFAAISDAANPPGAMLEGMHAAFAAAGILLLAGLGMSFSLRKKAGQNQAE
jgi:EmrB/QacA subfamily drug resistance transporter